MQLNLDRHRREVDHRGSIRYGVPEPRRDFHFDRGGSVRYEHHEIPWATRPFLVAPRYEHRYFERFRPDYRTVVIGPSSYYYYPVLPPGCQTVVVGGQYDYVCNGVYYLPYLYEGTTIYVVVPPP